MSGIDAESFEGALTEPGLRSVSAHPPKLEIVLLPASREGVERLDADVLVAPVAATDRPPWGVLGWVDYLLGGFISSLALDDRLDLAPGAWLVTDTDAQPGAFGAKRLALYGADPAALLNAPADPQFRALRQGFAQSLAMAARLGGSAVRVAIMPPALPKPSAAPPQPAGGGPSATPSPTDRARGLTTGRFGYAAPGATATASNGPMVSRASDEDDWALALVETIKGFRDRLRRVELLVPPNRMSALQAVLRAETTWSELVPASERVYLRVNPPDPAAGEIDVHTD
jgi:hypothetical protein